MTIFRQGDLLSSIRVCLKLKIQTLICRRDLDGLGGVGGGGGGSLTTSLFNKKVALIRDLVRAILH